MIVTRAPHSSTRLRRKQDGYIVIIVLLLTAVLLMLGLSLATRTTEEVYQSGQEADTTRVFNAAETGIEAALYQIETDPNLQFGETLGNIDDISNPDNLSTLLVQGEKADEFDISIPQGEVLTLEWNISNSTKIIWKHTGCTSAPAVIITLYNNTSPPTAHHVAYNAAASSSTACSGGSNFTRAAFESGVGSSVTLPNTNVLFGVTPVAGSLIRIRPLYADANFRIENSAATRIVSTATDNTGGTTEGKETRKIEVIRTEPAAPSIFDYAVFSGGSLEKN